MNSREPNRRGGEHDEFYAVWALQHTFCQACGVSEHQASQLNGGVPLSTHHIIGGAGRSHEACNLIRLCLFCHDLAEGKRRVDRKGVRREPLDVGEILAIKQAREPQDVDTGRLSELAGQTIDEPTTIPSWLAELYFRNRPWDRPGMGPS